MIVVMETTATREQINNVVARVKALGLGAHLSEGEERTIIGVVGSPLPPTLDATAYRVVQEALTNVLKHAAGPSRVDVVVRWAAGEVTLAVIDDGRPNAAPVTAGHGLQGMRERLSLFGGELTAGPATTGGWAVRVRLPLEEAP